MNEYIGMIKLWAGNFAPKYWSFCNGALINISSNTALYSILGTQYGGNGTTNFALPNLMSRVQIGSGTSPAGTTYIQGTMVGVETVTLVDAQLPAHNHSLNGINVNGNTNSPFMGLLANQVEISGRDTTLINGYSNGAMNSQLNPFSLKMTGNNVPHDNLQPYLALNYIICTQGNYPPRN